MQITPLTFADYCAWADLLTVALERQPSEMVQLLTFLQATTPAHCLWSVGWRVVGSTI